MMRWLARALWIAGSPVRLTLIWLIRAYRATLGQAMGGRCRFYPSCSAYAEAAITQLGPARGVPLAVWRVLRCSPLSKGGVDHPPAGHRTVAEEAAPPAVDPSLYDADIQGGTAPRVPRKAAGWSR